jgi:histidyl-tRNA synthetase
MKPSIPKGTRDFGPLESAKRNYIFQTIRQVFSLYGFAPIETPAMENLDTLTGKYGEEGDQLIFKILNSGNYTKGVDLTLEPKKLSFKIAEKALRYDLTVPFARYVVMHQNEIIFPFKRYQIQPVWRADRPQKGRYREFYQCDADIIGSKSLINEVELVGMTYEVFKRLGIRVIIKLNNRKILAGIAQTIGHPDKIIDITVAIDKLDKVGLDKVIEELLSKGIDSGAIDKLKPILQFKGNSFDKLDFLSNFLKDSSIGNKGIEEVLFVLNNARSAYGLADNELELDITLARGLNYYTGAIFEVKVNDPKSTFTGSISGGGRYDDLTGMFGLKGLSGVGISYGADRIYDVLQELSLFPEQLKTQVNVLFACMGSAEQVYCLPYLQQLRNKGISCELYPEPDKIKKQISYANQKQIPFVVIIGENEMKEEKFMLKNMQTGNQNLVNFNELLQFLNLTVA